MGAKIGRIKMKADKEVRIIAQLLEVKTELQEKALEVGATNRTKNFIKQEIKGIDKALEIVKKEFTDE